jgi:DNA polymerase III delta subunit
MLYLIYGTSAIKRQEAKLAILKKKSIKPEEVISRSGNEFSRAELEQVSGGTSLFGDRITLSLEFPSLDEKFYDELVAVMSELVASENIIFVIERELAKDVVKAYEKGGAEVVLCDEPKAIKKNDFNLFSITDPFSMRDKKGTWLLYRDAIQAEQAPEAIIGILFWAVKNMMLKKRFAKWSVSELEAASRELVRIVHQAHAGMFEIEEELERFILKFV